MTTPIIEIHELSKRFKHQLALDRLSLEVPAGSVFGFLGPNGAGKTTTIRILLGLARATSGTAKVHGTIGFLPDVPAFYPWMKAPEYLRFCASLFGLDATTTDRRIGLLLELAGLSGVRTPIGGYSRGMKQRLGVAQAMINGPELLILDEPTSALDPIGRHEVLALISSLAGHTTVFFSTHILSDVERVCDQVAVLAAGRLVAADRTAALRARYGGTQKIRVELVERRADLPSVLAGEPWLEGCERTEDAWAISVNDLDAAAHRLPQLAAAEGWGLRRLEPWEATLEDVFVKLVEGQLAEGRPSADQEVHR